MNPAPTGPVSGHTPGRTPVLGVFDSGVGGLTVLRSLLQQASSADYLYLGDTARLPYGSKSRATVARYAVSSARFLLEQGAEALVIACNTASALALDALREAVPVPVIGVIETGVLAAQQSSATGDVLVLATAATVHSGAYTEGCREAGMRALEMPCPLLVPLVEEGWIEHPVTRQVVSIYLEELLADAAVRGLAPDTLVLGCTHYPLLRGVIEDALASLTGGGAAPVRVIDSARVTADQAAARLGITSLPRQPQVRFYATDGIARFRELGSRFLGRPVDPVQLVDLGG
jgi:glutamate racemase